MTNQTHTENVPGFKDVATFLVSTLEEAEKLRRELEMQGVPEKEIQEQVRLLAVRRANERDCDS